MASAMLPPVSHVPENVLPAISAEGAKERNKNLILTLVAGLLNNPEPDLSSLIPSSYKAMMASHQSSPVSVSSKAAIMNRQVLGGMLSLFEADPTKNLSFALPITYSAQRRKRLRPVEADEEKGTHAKTQSDRPKDKCIS